MRVIRRIADAYPVDVDSESEAQSIAEALLRAQPRRLAHVQGVARAAKAVAERLDLAEQPLVAAAWLHDVGYAEALVDSGFHPLDGARYLRRQGWGPQVLQLVAHHSGAVIEAEERGLREQLLAEFPFEPSPMMDALWYCDMTTGPDGRATSVEQRLTEVRARYGPSDVVTRFVGRAEPELVAAVRRVEKRLAAAQSR